MSDGIYSHPGMVHPYSIDVTSSKDYVYQEPGFTLELPLDRKLKMKITAIRCMAGNNPEMQEWAEQRIKQVKIETLEEAAQILKRKFRA